MKRLKPNIVGRITKAKINYTPEDIDKGLLEPLHPEEIGKVYHGVKQNRIALKDITEFPDRLPTGDLTPYPIDEHDFIGQFESKKNIYLTLAYSYNKLMDRIEKLEAEIIKLKK